jgi:SAM-dependent methyltransferase
MRLDTLFYQLSYRFGHPRWDSDQPNEELVAMTQSLTPRRALDLGCGTGANAVFLAQHGWDVVGVDFAPQAIETARKRSLDTRNAVSFVLADVTRLAGAGVRGPFDLVLDLGCYHALPARLRDAYVAQLAAVTGPGADFYLAGVSVAPASWRLLRASGVQAGELRERFGASFELTEQSQLGPIGRPAAFVLYHLVRRPSGVLGQPVAPQGNCT